MRSLERAHPLVCFVYLAAVAGVTVFTRNPVLLALSLLGAIALLVLCGKGGTALWAAPAVLLCAATNPLFSHSGDTALFFIGNAAYTLEALIYGVLFGMALSAVCSWGVLAARFVTSDKYIWLLGRILPVSGLVLSCAMRFVPLFIRRAASFAAASGAESIGERLGAFSASLGYSAEQSMSSADSMKARGYGTARRTSYSIYRLGRVELTQLIAVLALSAICVVALIFGGGEFTCYPRISQPGTSTADIVLYAAFGVLCFLPAFAAAGENLRRAKRYSRIKER